MKGKNKTNVKIDFPLYGKIVFLKEEVISNDGSTFYDYSWEQHLKYLGFSLSHEEIDE